MVTITDVRVTGDLHDATIFYTVFGDETARADSAAALESAKGVLRSEVGRQTGVRFTPTLTFILDALPEDAQAHRRAAGGRGQGRRRGRGGAARARRRPARPTRTASRARRRRVRAERADGGEAWPVMTARRPRAASPAEPDAATGAASTPRDASPPAFEPWRPASSPACAASSCTRPRRPLARAAVPRRRRRSRRRRHASARPLPDRAHRTSAPLGRGRRRAGRCRDAVSRRVLARRRAAIAGRRQLRLPRPRRRPAPPGTRSRPARSGSATTHAFTGALSSRARTQSHRAAGRRSRSPAMTSLRARRPRCSCSARLQITDTDDPHGTTRGLDARRRRCTHVGAPWQISAMTDLSGTGTNVGHAARQRRTGRGRGRRAPRWSTCCPTAGRTSTPTATERWPG